MLKRHLEQRHIDLDSGRSCLALEREYWQALEVLAYEDGWNNWRDFFYMRVLPDKPEDIPNLYAITWQPIDECNGKLDANPTTVAPRSFR